MAELRPLVRVLNTDIPGTRNLMHGLRKIHGISFSMAHALCQLANMAPSTKVGSLTDAEVKKLEEIAKNTKSFPIWMLNRRQDPETGVTEHLTGTDLKLRREFDIKLMRKIKSYKGIRHSFGLPVRGQSTKAHFRHGKTIGVAKKPKLGKKG